MVVFESSFMIIEFRAYHFNVIKGRINSGFFGSKFNRSGGDDGGEASPTDCIPIWVSISRTQTRAFGLSS